MSNDNKTKRLLTVSMLIAISFILMFLKFPLPFLPPYLTMDFSDVPVLVATFAFGPVSGILVALFKNVLNFLIVSHEPIGNTANFLASVCLIIPTYYFYRIKKSKLFMGYGLITGVILMTVFMSLMNYFVLLPLYGQIMNLADLAHNLKMIVSAGIIPFNLIKGIVISVIYLIIFDKLKTIIK
ncbi:MULTISPECIES: ECF transporter S component [Mammaliicoccus]|uniref:Riboflavin transporter n=1 Tax=Mammaliicoccus vitulinus TaxID=71237 RepID=A0ABX7HEK8_9STAP|nr:MULTISPECIES: ECF transporter S component [Mammaliicoccus]MBM6628121.1 ECF transporter S component [Mammaliicoccus vitulinus]MBO3077146.1 ECF transporter S component [Mammaliicoccus vitulinus]MEB7656814.1 ECF transporter S component [Mammaliicoccus vitulinus]PNZ38088.1 ECF transporter S component [Mammaliicoccus vitulinus]PTI36408.1 ECF transporter S component [Mammaliicoccus vitulinus]